MLDKMQNFKGNI